jgi:hypothetical protein
MANVFETFTSRGIGTSLAEVGAHTVAASTTETIIGLTLANKSAAAVNVTVTYSDGASNTHIIKDAPIPSGSSLVPIGGDQKLVLTTGDAIKVSANTASSVDVVMSVLQST